MAKVSGAGQTTLSCDNAAGSLKDIKNDVTNWDIATPYNSQVITGVDKNAEERLNTIADASGQLNTVFNPTADRGHAVLSGDLRVVRTLTHVIAGATFTCEALLSDYKVQRSTSAELTAQSPWSLADGTLPAWT